MKVDIPKYQQIAANMAEKIANGHYKEGEKIYVKSSLSSQYGVSSETARRAVCVLNDLKIVETAKGSGVIIASKEKAKEFVKQFLSIQQMNSLRHDIFENINQQHILRDSLKEMINDLFYKTGRFKTMNPFVPFETFITEHCLHLNESIFSLNFWHNTSATIIAIKRDDAITLSPGPYAQLQVGDTLYYIGDESSHERVRNFLGLLE